MAKKSTTLSEKCIKSCELNAFHSDFFFLNFISKIEFHYRFFASIKLIALYIFYIFDTSVTKLLCNWTSWTGHFYTINHKQYSLFFHFLFNASWYKIEFQQRLATYHTVAMQHCCTLHLQRKLETFQFTRTDFFSPFSSSLNSLLIQA